MSNVWGVPPADPRARISCWSYGAKGGTKIVLAWNVYNRGFCTQRTHSTPGLNRDYPIGSAKDGAELERLAYDWAPADFGAAPVNVTFSHKTATEWATKL